MITKLVLKSIFAVVNMVFAAKIALATVVLFRVPDKPILVVEWTPHKSQTFIEVQFEDIRSELLRDVGKFRIAARQMSEIPIESPCYGDHLTIFELVKKTMRVSTDIRLRLGKFNTEVRIQRFCRSPRIQERIFKKFRKLDDLNEKLLDGVKECGMPRPMQVYSVQVVFRRIEMFFYRLMNVCFDFNGGIHGLEGYEGLDNDEAGGEVSEVGNGERLGRGRGRGISS